MTLRTLSGKSLDEQVQARSLTFGFVGHRKRDGFADAGPDSSSTH
jgi:hypothetical protein